MKGTCRGPSDSPVGVSTLAHATSTRGADHLRGRSWAFGENDPEIFPKLREKGYVPEDPVLALIVSENACTLADSIGRCKGSVNNWAAAVPLVHKYPLWNGVTMLLSALTGVEFKPQDVVDAVERTYNIERAFLIRQGIKRRDDRLVLRPNLMGTKETEEEIRKHERFLSKYYQIRGWDWNTAAPTPLKT